MPECPIPLHLNPQHPNWGEGLVAVSSKVGICFSKGAAVLGTLTELGAQRGTAGLSPWLPSGLARAQGWEDVPAQPQHIASALPCPVSKEILG